MHSDSARVVGADGRSFAIGLLARVNPWLAVTLILLVCAGQGGGGCGTPDISRGPRCPTGTVQNGSQCVARRENHYTCQCTCPVVAGVSATTDLNVCVPPALNLNLAGAPAPSVQEIADDRSSRVA